MNIWLLTTLFLGSYLCADQCKMTISVDGMPDVDATFTHCLPSQSFISSDGLLKVMIIKNPGDILVFNIFVKDELGNQQQWVHLGVSVFNQNNMDYDSPIVMQGNGYSITLEFTSQSVLDYLALIDQSIADELWKIREQELAVQELIDQSIADALFIAEEIELYGSIPENPGA